MNDKTWAAWAYYWFTQHLDEEMGTNQALDYLSFRPELMEAAKKIVPNPHFGTYEEFNKLLHEALCPELSFKSTDDILKELSNVSKAAKRT